MRLDADLVVLSACETALGEDLHGEGLIGLTRAFQYARARSVVASLWAVPDDSTATLMRIFHDSLHAGSSIDKALRNAQLSLIRRTYATADDEARIAGVDTSQPYFWTGFALYGDWR
jgi:CHAT domain-containing protein